MRVQQKLTRQLFPIPGRRSPDRSAACPGVYCGDVTTENEFASAKEAASDARILVFGRLLGAANGLEYLLGKELEEQTGLSHSLFELLLIVGRAGVGGLSVRDIAQAKVVTSGGATRLVHRAVEQGLVSRRASADDGRVQLIELTAEGERAVVEAAGLHARNIERLLLSVLPAENRAVFEESVRTLSKHASGALPVMP